MNNLLKMVIAPYFMLGAFMGGVAFSRHSSWHCTRDALLIIVAIHVSLGLGAYFLARKSIRNGTQLSPSGLAIGFGMAYFAGFIIFLFV